MEYGTKIAKLVTPITSNTFVGVGLEFTKDFIITQDKSNPTQKSSPKKYVKTLLSTDSIFFVIIERLLFL
jgi:hypothetical protein